MGQQKRGIQRRELPRVRRRSVQVVEVTGEYDDEVTRGNGARGTCRRCLGFSLEGFNVHACFAALPLSSVGTQQGHRKTLRIQRIERY